MSTFVSVWIMLFCFVGTNIGLLKFASGTELTFNQHRNINKTTVNQLLKNNANAENESDYLTGKNAATGGKETAATFVNNSLSGCLSPVAGFFSSEKSSGPTHFQVVWQTPFNPMTFYILSAKINDADLLPGDEIGIFDIDPTSGNEICVGAGVLMEVLNGTSYLEIIASMNDGSSGQTNGFTTGNPILYKFWTPENGEITGVIPSYPFPGYDEMFTPLGTAFAELKALVEVAQTVNLQPGWNLTSFRVQPQNPDMLSVVQPLVSLEILSRVLDENGGSIYQLPFQQPAGEWVNTIGDMANTEGYYFKMTTAGELSLTGTPAELPFEIPLKEGWNMVGYPCNVSQDAIQVFGPLIENSALLKVMDEQGRIVFHMPFPEPAGQWINTIGDLEPNKGYYLKVLEETTLVLNEPTIAHPPSKSLQTNNKTSHFTVVWQNNPFMPMQIILEANEALTTGDEIGIFDGSLCAGAAVYDGNIGNPLIIVCSLDDPYNEMPDGFTDGDQISFQIWDNETQTLIDNPEIEFLEGHTTFAALENLTGKIVSLTTSIPGSGGNDFHFVVSPNPSFHTPVIKFYIPVTGKLTLKVFNIAGNLLMNADDIALDKGFFEIPADKYFSSTGVYTLDYWYFYQDKIIHGSNKLIILK